MTKGGVAGAASERPLEGVAENAEGGWSEGKAFPFVLSGLVFLFFGPYLPKEDNSTTATKLPSIV